MAFRPFGKDVGPSMNPRPVVTPFGHFPRPPSSPSGPSSQRAQSPSVVRPFQPAGVQSSTEPGERMLSPALAFQHSRPHASPYQFPGIQSGPEAPKRFPSPPLNFQNSGAAVRSDLSAATQSNRRPEVLQRLDTSPPSSDRIHPAASPPYLSTVNHRPVQTPHSWGNGSRSFVKGHGVQSHPRPAASFAVSRSSGTNVAEIAKFQDPKRTRSPPSFTADRGVSRNFQPPLLQSHSNFPVDQSPSFPPRKRSPQSAFENSHFLDDFHPPSSQVRRPSPPSMEDIDSYEVADMPDPGRTKSQPKAPSHRVLHGHPKFSQNPRRALSPPALSTSSNAPVSNSDSQFPERPLSTACDLFGTHTRTTSSLAPKRTRSPPLLSAEEVFDGNIDSSQDGTEREEQAKAKRLARFKGELDAMPIRTVDTADDKFSVNKFQRSSHDGQKFDSVESDRNALKADALSDYESLESTVIIGLCPDMCPESEREERERKGDLDQYERVDGDRNQTSKYLAVKKYNRTAEREANLIRPMPILQKTMDYLLSLLDQPYDESFLGMYNFLWDRMRAIRMDLRMQHIFNQEAINMLEQMIRLHIIAMHELCEYTKGEGFAEGFDAHLNIEQMNKTSVELFQMYDDHRKKGINIPTEKEFRGYYALLKLDKHPGYKVEPAELSLDLAKMTPEIRQTPEVVFARNVARACRTGNFIAFFRLARKASYLQACLMHAHFAKLRTLALASLHSGLLNNQGLPVSDVAKWIGMEEEDKETLLEYHGFSLKEFEEPYMMKDGPFLNADKDYATKCSKLVHLKKSSRIVEDVSASPSEPSPPEATKGTRPSISVVPIPPFKKQSSFHAVDEEMPDLGTSSLPKEGKLVLPQVENPMVEQQSQDDRWGAGMFRSPRNFSSPRGSPRFSQAESQSVERPNYDTCFSILPGENKFLGAVGTQTKIISGTVLEQSSPRAKSMKMVAETALQPGSPKTTPTKMVAGTPFQPGSPRTAPRKIVEGIVQSRSPKTMPTKMVAGAALQQSSPKAMPMPIIPQTSPLRESPPSSEDEYALEDSVPQNVLSNKVEDEEPCDIDQEKENEVGVVESPHDEEVVAAKLKLMIRLWRRWASRQREFRERRQLEASAALNSLSLGPPIRLSKDDQPSTSGEFDIDHAMRKRLEKHEQSWLRLNVSDVTMDILNKRNADAKCLCWKIILCAQLNSVDMMTQGSQVAQSVAGKWLLSKLMPSGEDNDTEDDLVLSVPGLSIWKKWVANQSDSDLRCCLSVVRDVEVDGGLNETISGASAVLFLVLEGIPWNLQRDRLNNLVMSIPSGSRLPLLVISGSYTRHGSDHTSCIVDDLGLHDIDKSRVSGFSVLSLVDGGYMGNTDQFYSDERLREGLQWLASNSPLQPELHCLKPRDLMLTHLNSSLEVLEKMPDHGVGPNHYISAFNDALDQSLRNIASAAESNLVGWPCPEIALLEGSTNESLMVNWHLPSIGWSSEEKVEPLESSLKDCKLPHFHDDLAWLTIGCGLGQEIENQRLRLESCLIEYLAPISRLMGVTLASNEACVMLQRSTRLELNNSSYYIIPKWFPIFQRIFHWRLTRLSHIASPAYVLKSHLVALTSRHVDKLEVEDGIYSSYASSLPALDEVIEVGCSPLKSPRDNQARPASFLALPITIHDHGMEEADYTGESMQNRNEFVQQVSMVVEDDNTLATNQLNNSKIKNPVDAVSVGADRLSELLEKCNILQNNIAEKLSIYF